MSLGSSLGAVQTAIYALLSGDATLTALCPVYDEVPEGTAYPYLLIGEAVENPDNRGGGKVGKSILLTFEAWSEQRTFDQVNAIMKRVDQLLDNNLTITVTGYDTELLNCESVTTSREGILRKAMSVYTLMVVES